MIVQVDLIDMALLALEIGGALLSALITLLLVIMGMGVWRASGESQHQQTDDWHEGIRRNAGVTWE